jgi:hypothetical protein
VELGEECGTIDMNSAVVDSIDADGRTQKGKGSGDGGIGSASGSGCCESLRCSSVEGLWFCLPNGTDHAKRS